MKKIITSILALSLIVSCQINELASEHVPADDNLYASIEPVNTTKTVMDENNNVLWSDGDKLVAFMKTTLGVKYQIMEQFVGTTTGGFSKLNEPGNEDDLESGQELDHNVVLYPHSYDVWCMKNDDNVPTQSYRLNVTLPETQSYEENTFGIGTFPMIAVSPDNKLTFRNICGGLKLQFKGVDKIKSIKLEGLGGEKISGKSTVVGYVDGSAPVITMASDDESYSHVILDCGEGVQLSETAPTTFIIAVPPIEFASGLKITVTDTDGLSRTLKNSSSNTIKRSSLLTFPVITYEQEGVFEIPEGTLTTYEIPAAGGIVEIPVTTNLEYEVTIQEEAKDWITLAQTRALSKEVITLNILENTIEEIRSSEVLVTAAGEILQVITVNQEAYTRIPQEDDYVDEYGVNHGQGIKIDETVWAPVNCGYHETDYPYGKLYQWGRKYGQGYSGELYVGGWNHTHSDASVPTLVEGSVSISTGQDISNSNNFYTGSYNNGRYCDWFTSLDDAYALWNSGTKQDPIKTEYDPCPKGWRVPTPAELKSLSKNYSSWTAKDGQNGYWFSGSVSYSESAPRVFFPAAGSRSTGAFNRGGYGFYWSSSELDTISFEYLEFNLSGEVSISGCGSYYGYSVRCVQDKNSEEPSESQFALCLTYEIMSANQTVNLAYNVSQCAIAGLDNELICINYGDGMVGTSLSHTYSEAGIYNVQMTFKHPISEIGKDAFYNCAEFVGIQLPESLTKIGEYAFLKSGLRGNLMIPDNNVQIGSNAFALTGEFESFIVPFGTNFTGGSGQFMYICAKKLYMGANVPDDINTWYSGCMFEGARIEKLIIGNQVTILGSYALGSNSPKYIKNIEFEEPSSLEYIGDAAFSNNAELVRLELPHSIDYISPHYTFDLCPKLETIQKSYIQSYWSEDGILYSFGDNGGVVTVFRYPEAKKGELFENNLVGHIAPSAFRDNKHLKKISVGLVDGIGNCAFMGCANLTEIEGCDYSLGNAYAYEIYIGESAFRECTSLKEFTIGLGVDVIKSSAFYDCTSLERIYLKSSIPPALEDNNEDLPTFANNASERLICVPLESVELYKETSGWNVYKHSIVGYIEVDGEIVLVDAQ